MNMETINRTPFTLDEVKALRLIGRMVNKWRQRNVYLYQHPTERDGIVSIGVAFDGSQQVICVESKGDYTNALDYIDQGRVYIYE